MLERAEHLHDSSRPASGLRMATVICGAWLGAGTVAAGVLLATGPGPAWWAALGSLAGLAVAGSLALGNLADRASASRLAAMAQAAGLSGDAHSHLSAIGIVERLKRQLERAHHFRGAIEALDVPLLVIEGDGTIVTASRGAGALGPDVGAAATLDAVFGAGYLQAGGGVPEESMVLLGGQRLTVLRRSLPSGRFVLQFTPAGHFVADDDLDAFVGALGAGQTGFRFEADVAQINPALASLNAGMETLDAGIGQLRRAVMAGEPPELKTLPLAGAAGRVSALYTRLHGDLMASEAARLELENQLSALPASLATKTEARIAALEMEIRAVGTARATAEGQAAVLEHRLEAMQAGEQQASALALDAGKSAQRTETLIAEISRITAEVDGLTATIEDVSFRTNLLALNAAVEAARAGEKGAGFAVVADEVRQLAQISTRAAKDIRSAVDQGRAQARSGVAEAQSLQAIVAQLDGRLRNLRNETPTIAAVSKPERLQGERLVREAGGLSAGQHDRRATA